MKKFHVNFIYEQQTIQLFKEDTISIHYIEIIANELYNEELQQPSNLFKNRSPLKCQTSFRAFKNICEENKQ